ncbi:MAG: O-antigen ligase family protein [Aquabacterium sp.]
MSYLSASTTLRQQTARQSGIAGLIVLFASIAFLADLFWLMKAGQLFMLQLPILALCFGIVLIYGMGYVMNPPAWLILALFSLVYLAQDVTFKNPQGGGDLQTIIKGGLAFALMALSLYTGLKPAWRSPVLRIWLAYAIFAMCSAVYSSMVILAIGSGIALLAVALASARISEKTEHLQWTWQSVYWGSLLVAIGSLLLMGISSSMARDISDATGYRLRGITGSANALGPMVGIGLLTVPLMLKLASTPTRRWLFIGSALVLIATLALARSRSSIIGVLGGFVIVFAITRRHTIWSILIGLLTASLALIVVAQPRAINALLGSLTKLISRSGDVAELTTFTGRADIWQASWRLIENKPWIGYGLGSIRIELPKVFQDEWGNIYTTAHNFLLESLISVGIVGTTLLLICFVWSTIGLTRKIRQQATAGTDSAITAIQITALRCLVFLWLYAMMEKAFAGTVSPVTVVLGLCIATFSHARAAPAPSTKAARASS